MDYTHRLTTFTSSSGMNSARHPYLYPLAIYNPHLHLGHFVRICSSLPLITYLFPCISTRNLCSQYGHLCSSYLYCAINLFSTNAFNLICFGGHLSCFRFASYSLKKVVGVTSPPSRMNFSRETTSTCLRFPLSSTHLLH